MAQHKAVGAIDGDAGQWPLDPIVLGGSCNVSQQGRSCGRPIVPSQTGLGPTAAGRVDARTIGHRSRRVQPQFDRTHRASNPSDGEFDVRFNAGARCS